MENPPSMELILSEFSILEDSSIPRDAMKKAKAANDARLDVIWGYLNGIQDTDGIRRFENLSRASLLLFTISHSNAGEKRIFTMTTKNKTCFTPNPDPYETWGSVITIKLTMQEKGATKMAFKPEFLS